MPLMSEPAWRRACAAALAGLPGITPRRLSALLGDAPPDTVWHQLGDGMQPTEALVSTIGQHLGEVLGVWRRHVRQTDPADVLARYDQAGVGVWTPFDEYPGKLTGDPWRPMVLFHRGNSLVISAPTVGIVGTRRCSAEGLANARRFGAELAEAGVAVVSGLALGIDGAAHAGALSVTGGAPPIGVAGNGLDIVYPKRHRELWRDVGEHGLLVSESALGVSPEAWRFPARNRIIAGLSQVLLVVESNKGGGSLLTANEALMRNVDVMAVPGSIRSRASVGTNALLRDGAIPACSTQDVLEVLSMNQPDHVLIPLRLPLDDDLPVLEAVERYPTSTDDVMLRTGCSMGEIAVALLRLEESGWISGIDGWWQRVNDDTAEGAHCM